MCKILITTPLCVPSYFNAGHRLPIYVVAAYLRKQGYDVVALDIASLNTTWKDFVDLLVNNQFEFIAILNDFDLIEGFSRFINYVREFSPNTKIITYGRLSSIKPNLFHSYGIDGIVVSGDYEAGISQFIANFGTEKIISGVQVRSSNGWLMPTNPGQFLSPDEWVLPHINEISYSSYEALYGSDQRKYCGIPDQRELIVPLARGCPIGCEFCEVWSREGRKERRLPVERVIQYIENSFENEAFDYVSMYAPTFTLRKSWVRNLCYEFISRDRKYPWKCTTTLFHLDKDLVKLMGRAGCFRISVGLESFEEDGIHHLPIQKMNTIDQFNKLIKWCDNANIQLNCFVIVGLPGTSVAGTQRMISYLHGTGVRVRPAIYSDYKLLHPEMSEQELIANLSRHIIPPNANFAPEERRELYKLAYMVEADDVTSKLVKS